MKTQLRDIENHMMGMYRLSSDTRMAMGPKERQQALEDHIKRVDEMFFAWRDFIKERKINE